MPGDATREKMNVVTNPNQKQDLTNSRIEGGPNDPNDINLDFDHGAETTTEMGDEN